MRIAPEDAKALIEFVEAGHVAICHASLDKSEVVCGGAEAFRRGSSLVFKSAAAMVRAHRRSRRKVRGVLWGIDS